MEKKQVVFVRLSPRLPPDVKTFIGTILISELLQAVQHRGTLPPDQRHQFCIFVDEFQTFASYQDFAVLFTQARKFGIATTVAHQERYGQFADNKAILGATDAAGNKVFFQLTVRDAEEQAPEFAKPAPMESKLEPGISITNNPFLQTRFQKAVGVPISTSNQGWRWDGDRAMAGRIGAAARADQPML